MSEAPRQTGGPASTPARRRRATAILTGKILLVLVGIWLAVQALRQVDWAQVGDALGRLVWWEILVIVLLIAVRQTVNASTLIILVPRLRLPNALSTALSGTLVQTFAPPPSDTVLRLSMLRSYGVETTPGAAALVLDTLVFYMARFTAPIVGLAVAAAALLVEPIQVWMALGGVIAAVILTGALLLVSKGEQAAGNMGHTAARIVRRLRPTVDPNAWAAALIRFQKESATGLVGRIGKATTVMLGFIVVDAVVIVVCLRFVGIPGEHIGYLSVLAAVLSLYPLTIFPFAGLGVLDASLIVLINAEGVADSADLVAALVIWRTATLLLPLLPGLMALTRWRARQPATGPSSPTPPVDPPSTGETS